MKLPHLVGRVTCHQWVAGPHPEPSFLPSFLQMFPSAVFWCPYTESVPHSLIPKGSLSALLGPLIALHSVLYYITILLQEPKGHLHHWGDNSTRCKRKIEDGLSKLCCAFVHLLAANL